MKKVLMMMLALVLTVPTMGQRLKYALVKDEGGVTNVRKGPGTKYSIVEKVPDGSPILVGASSGGWTKVYNSYTNADPDLMGWISTSKVVYVKRQGAYKEVGMVKQEGGYTNIRKGPGTQYAVVEKVKDGSFILYSGDYGDKWKAVYTQQGKLRGYISGNKIEALESPRF